MKNGKLLCTTCREKRPRHEGVRNWSLPKLHVPEEETPEEKPQTVQEVVAKAKKEGRFPTKKELDEVSEPVESDAIDRAKEEQLDRKC